MSILNSLGKKFLFFDGAMGTMLQKRGLPTGKLCEEWNIENADEIVSIHLEYLNAGANIITANTFGANAIKFPNGKGYSVEEIVSSAIDNAKKAVDLCENGDEHYIALDIGPLGKLLKPFGDMDFEDAVSMFAQTVRAGAKSGADLIIIETMNDLSETRAAVIAAKENSNLPIFVTNAYDESGKLMTGACPEAVCACLEGLGVDAIGINCSFGPRESMSVIERLCKVSSIPVIASPNAGLPVFDGKDTKYDTDETEFADYMEKIADLGVQVLGGCCGTTPEYIRETKKRLSGKVPHPTAEKNLSVISSYTHAVEFGKKCVIIGERINPTGKKAFKEALRNHDIDYILNVGLKQEEAGAEVLDVNVGLPEIDECTLLPEVICALQGVTSVPLQIDTSDDKAMEKALRLYSGKAMINSVNGKKECMEKVFPLVKKYGGLVVALTLDENGIPETAEERVKIAEKIYGTAEKYGIKRKDIITDTLTMAVSTDVKAGKVTLDALSAIHKMGGLTSLGVSNVSFGLPKRDIINASFFTLALEKGLDGAIINPHSVEMMKAYKSFMALSGKDENFEDYISFAQSIETETVISGGVKESKKDVATLKDAIIKGLKESAYEMAKKSLLEKDALDIINTEIVPALDIIGKGFEEKKIYLPQLLISAEAAKSAFEAVKEKMRASGEEKRDKLTVILATVKGDVHDIGKNIVKALLENYSFNVIDLGKDVSPEFIVQKAKETGAKLVGLSALMTTTVASMKETIELLKEKVPDVKTIVGGAVLTEEYARMLGADAYSPDAMGAVRYAQSLCE